MADRLYSADEVASLLQLHDRLKEQKMSAGMAGPFGHSDLASHAAAHSGWPHLAQYLTEDEYDEEEEEDEEPQEMSLRDMVTVARAQQQQKASSGSMPTDVHPIMEWARKQAASGGDSERKYELEDVQQYISSRPDAYVVFYAGWCGHCHHLLNLLRINISGSRETGFSIDGQYPNVLLIENGTASDDLKEKMGVDGFPTVFHYKSGRPVSDQSHENQEALLNYVESLQSFHARPEILSVENLKMLRPQRLASTNPRHGGMMMAGGARSQAFSPEIARMLFGGGML
jgi:hypothetical protein